MLTVTCPIMLTADVQAVIRNKVYVVVNCI